MRAAIILILMVCALSGCAEAPVINENGLRIDKDTSANIEDLGVGSLTRKF